MNELTVDVLDGGRLLRFGLSDLMRYHGPAFPGGVAHGFTWRPRFPARVDTPAGTARRRARAQALLQRGPVVEVGRHHLPAPVTRLIRGFGSSWLWAQPRRTDTCDYCPSVERFRVLMVVLRTMGTRNSRSPAVGDAGSAAGH